MTPPGLGIVPSREPELPAGATGYDGAIESVSDRDSSSSVRDETAWKMALRASRVPRILEKQEFTPRKLQLIPVQLGQLTSGRLQNIGDSMAGYLQWHASLQSWMQFTLQRMETLRTELGKWTVPVENTDISARVASHDYWMSELKKYVDLMFGELWEKLREIWNYNSVYCQSMSGLQDQQVAMVNQMSEDVRTLFTAVQKITDTHLPDLVGQYNFGVNDLAENTHSCMAQLHGHLEKLSTDLREVDQLFQQVGVNFAELFGRVQALESAPVRVHPSVTSESSSDFVLSELHRIDRIVKGLHGKIGGLQLNNRLQYLDAFKATVDKFMSEFYIRVTRLEDDMRIVGTVSGKEEVRDLRHRVLHLEKALGEHQKQLQKKDRDLEQRDIEVQRLMFHVQQLECQQESTSETVSMLLEEMVRRTSGPRRMPRYAPEHEGEYMEPSAPPLSNAGRHVSSGSEIASGSNMMMMEKQRVSPGSVPEGGNVRPPVASVPMRSMFSMHESPFRREAASGFPTRSQPFDTSEVERTARPLSQPTQRSAGAIPMDPGSPVRPEASPTTVDSGKFNPTVHQMVSNMLKFESWSGDWNELEDWLETWKLYTEAGCTGANPKTRTLLFMERMPEKYGVYFRVQLTSQNWTEKEMIDWLFFQKGLRMPSHLRVQAWKELVPSGNTYQHLVNWFQKWTAKLKTVEVTEIQVLDQFDLNVKDRFPKGIREVLKAEQELKISESNPRRKIPLEQRYQMLLKYVSISDNVRALEGGEKSGYHSSGGSQSSRTSSNWSRRDVREVKPRRERSGNCNFCKKPGHWMSDCPVWLERNKKLGNCLTCGLPGHWSRDCPRKKQYSSGATSSTSKPGSKQVRVRPQRKIEARRSDSSDRSGSGSRRPRGKTSSSAAGKGYGRRGRSRTPSPKGKSSRDKGKERVAAVESVEDPTGSQDE